MYFLKFRREADGHHVVEIPWRGRELYAEPMVNKGTAFTAEERRRFGLEGLLPPTHRTMETQVRQIRSILDSRTRPLSKYLELACVQDINEHLFFRVLCENLEELLPIVYTPTVAEATKLYSHVFRRQRGIFITPEHRGQIAAVLRQAIRFSNAKLIVATDNEAILGIGDQGAGGIAISIGKLAIYSAAGGIHPVETLPVSLDVGTDNKLLLEDDLYLGHREPRLRGEPYFELLDEFVNAVSEVLPGAVVQWEDFRKDNALAVLHRYDGQVASFNDDIQGTGAIAVAGVLSACRMLKQRISEQRIIVYGGGAAGLGITEQLRAAMIADGATTLAAREAIAVLDSRGLLVDDVPQKEAYKEELAWPMARAAALGLAEPSHRNLAAVVRQFKPTVLIGTSGVRDAFSEELVRDMARHVERPVILPLSNPTDNAEAAPADLIAWTENRCLVATGSPFPPVKVEGRTIAVAQGNNAFIFPGLGLGLMVGEIKRVTPGILAAAARALTDTVTSEETKGGMLFPRISRMGEAARAVAVAVVAQAAQEGVGRSLTPDEADREVFRATWTPDYPELVPAE
jgi:malate dehydrogenase (oxaloacetate-decarboxylating)